MTIYSLYIFDRHCSCVYYHDWHRSLRAKVATEGNILPAVSHEVYSKPTEGDVSGTPTPSYPGSRLALSSSTGVVVAVNEQPPPTPATAATQTATQATTSSLSFDEEAKLVYGVILSLRNLIKKLSGRDEQFVNYRTSTYKLHLFETVSGFKFVMLSDPNTDSLRFILRQIYAGPFLEYVVKNPLVSMDSKERGIDNELFRLSTDRLVRNVSVFS
ncbi:TRAPP complex subunit bet5 [Sistotremastrum suecicum HHB10207 ss-3]|uniref:Trafficking protein particle complex subunit n=1 Tax=Sistotremastrum suecicum HHB10207 ss-3 TaxID=1314776 RepID=A0A166G9W3_9AGAM|nr:TRAPP complex subunit bet5 [Sistotremastrum suecicum HHB10207 ss-3]